MDDASNALKKAADDLEGVGKGVDDSKTNPKNSEEPKGGCLIGRASTTDVILGFVFGVVEVRADAGCLTTITSKDGGMLGKNGVQTASKEMYRGSKYRVDVENPKPGVRPGQVHVQDYTDNKYYYNPNDNALYIKTGNTFEKAGNSVQKILDNDDIIKGINKGLQYLGE